MPIVVYAAFAALIALALVAGIAAKGNVIQAGHTASAVSTSQIREAAVVPAVELVAHTPARAGWKADTARFAGCLGGFGIAAAPVVAGFMFGGPAGAKAAAKAWFPRLGPVGTNTMKWCLASVLGVRF
ncbi:hypothetical protein [Rhodococcus sp. T7]|uniref:hypothetical protein n=1 Tax=Rhodococcus sp. T7 TaxID=627444 RepID=UPI0019176B07|nr:hypothetical protein [Rhodococcus sp. T7]